MHRQVVFDTNILVYFFDGNTDAASLLETEEYFLSAISYVEILSNLKSSPEKKTSIKNFLTSTTIIQTTPGICDKATKFRLSYEKKLPDVIIAATAHYLEYPLITVDAAFFKIKEIEIIPFIK